MTPRQRLDRIAFIIEAVDYRCAWVDGPVTPTLQEMTQAEMSEIYRLACSGSIKQAECAGGSPPPDRRKGSRKPRRRGGSSPSPSAILDAAEARAAAKIHRAYKAAGRAEERELNR